ncbi:hypothetical protein MMC11_000068 [Xylographa trunciseda]|nr:hypothetical protein [Xylographa trunciseda]
MDEGKVNVEILIIRGMTTKSTNRKGNEDPMNAADECNQRDIYTHNSFILTFTAPAAMQGTLETVLLLQYQCELLSNEYYALVDECKEDVEFEAICERGNERNGLRLQDLFNDLNMEGLHQKTIVDGRNLLLDFKIQETYYNKIVERYMQFCAAAGRHDDALDKAFASLSLDTVDRKIVPGGALPPGGAISSLTVNETSSTELAVLTMSMRKLREAIVASSRTDTFAQRAYVFIIRAMILTSTYESYHPALLHLLYSIHPSTPLPSPELHEFVSYHVLDLSCRLGDLGNAFSVRRKWGFRDKRVEVVLKALVHDDWVNFWRIRGAVDGYQRKLMGWAEEGVRKHALKCLGRSYLGVDKVYVERCAGRTWEELKLQDGVGWELEGDKVTIRRMKAK